MITQNRLILFGAALMLAHGAWAQGKLQDVIINYPAKAPADWPLFVTKEGGYYEKYGMNGKLAFGVHPAGIAMVVSGEAAMTNYTLGQAMQAASKDGSLLIMGSDIKNGLFALMAHSNIASPRDLKGKRIGVSQLGDAPYNYTVAILSKFGIGSRDVQWVPLGTDSNGRAAALISNRVDATMIPPPAYFRMEQQGLKAIANLADYDDIYAPMVYVFKRTTVASNPKLVENLIKAHAEGIKRLYDDRAFAVSSYLKYDPQQQADIERIYDHDKPDNTYERVPYVLADAVKFTIEHEIDPQVQAQLKAYDFRKVIDNSVVERLVKQGFFEKLYGPSIKAEEERKAKLAFKK